MFLRRSMVRAGVSRLLVVCAVASGCSTVFGGEVRPFTQRLPGEAVLYFEWAGWDALESYASETPLGKLLATPGVSRLIAESVHTLELVVRKQAAESNEVEAAEAAANVVETLWRKRVAIDVLRVAMSKVGPAVDLALAVDVGDGADRFVRSLEQLAVGAKLPAPTEVEIDGTTFKWIPLPLPSPIRYAVVDGVFVLTVGDATSARVLSCLSGKGKTVSDDARFRSAMNRIGEQSRETWMTLHLDAMAAIDLARRAYQTMSGGETFPPMAEAVLSSASLDRLRSITGVWQVADRGFRQSWLIALPTENGRPKWMSQSPITDADIAMVPGDVTFAKIVNMRLVDVYDGLMHVIAAAGPAVQTPVSNALAELEGRLNLRIREDILAILGDGLIAYVSPTSGGFAFTGVTMLIEAKDPQRVSNMFDRVFSAIGEQVEALSVSIEDRPYKGHTIRLAALTGLPIPVAPAWSIYENHVVVGLYPQIVMRALDHLMSDGRAGSLLEREDFVRRRKTLPSNCSAIVYSDTREVMANVYSFLLPAATAGVTWARSHGTQIDAAMIPTHDEFVGAFFGDVYALAPGDDGLLAVGVGSAPVPLILASAPTVATALAVSVLLPSLARARTIAKKAVSQSNVRQILIECKHYAQEHSGQFPDRLETLVTQGAIERKLLHSPRGGGDGAVYIYLAGHTTADPAKTVLIHESLDFSDGDCLVVGYIDGTVEMLSSSDLRRRLDAQNAAERTGDGEPGL